MLGRTMDLVRTVLGDRSSHAALRGAAMLGAAVLAAYGLGLLGHVLP